MEFFKIRRTIPFMRYALVFNIISLVTFLAAVVFLATKGLNFSIEFTGGTLIEVGYAQPADVERIRQSLEKAGYKAEVQNFGSSREVLIRMHLEKNQSSADLSQKVLAVLKQDNQSAGLRRVEFVGPQVGRELAEYGALALLVTAVGIVLYLWMRFEWRFGLSAIVANLHDVVIILGFFAFFQWEFSLAVLAAVLAVLGYSGNESVVVFDRVRENFRKMRKASTPEVIDASITGVISRTIITHGCTQMMVTTMLIFGGPALHYFAAALTIGILFGIYSSVLVASPLVMSLVAKREHPVSRRRGVAEERIEDDFRRARGRSGLRGRPHHDLVDVHFGRFADRKHDRTGDGIGGDLVLAEDVDHFLLHRRIRDGIGEFRGGRTGGDGGDADVLADFLSQAVGERMHGELGGAVHCRGREYQPARHR
jgi:preprotein translocase subunit SecF